MREPALEHRNDRAPVADDRTGGFFAEASACWTLQRRVIRWRPAFTERRRATSPGRTFAGASGRKRPEIQHCLYITTRPVCLLSRNARCARRLKRQKGLDVLVVDYLQLLSGSKSRSENRVQELTEITTGLKALAKELEVPIVALSQLSRQVESRDDKRPQLSDLRESGSIEQDADVVIFVYREEYYLKNREPRPGTPEHIQWISEMERAHGRAEVIIGKQRHGPTGTVELQFEAELTRFSNLAREESLAEIR